MAVSQIHGQILVRYSKSWQPKNSQIRDSRRDLAKFLAKLKFCMGSAILHNIAMDLNPTKILKENFSLFHVV